MFLSFVVDVSDLFEFYFVSFVDIDELLLLLMVVCNLYFSYVIEYVFNVYVYCLVLNMGIYENNIIILGDLFFKVVLFINKEKS